jgi:hypothetical protein
MNKTKLIHEVDDQVWRQFVGSCIAEGVLVGHKLTDILKKENERK